jgi:hypothetical protein
MSPMRTRLHLDEMFVAALAAIAALALAALSACEPPPPEAVDHAVVFSVSSDTGDPVAGVRLFRPGAEIGKTGQDGRLAAHFQAPDGALVTVHAQCPDGFIDPIEDTTVVLRELSSVATGSGRRVSIQCRRTRVLAAIVVRAGYPNLPVLLNGEEITRTSATGVAHVSAAVPPHETFSLTIDTSSGKRLVPKNPGTTYTMSAEDSFFVFDSPLEALPEPRKPKPRPKPKPKPQAPLRPILIPPNAHLGKSSR